MIVEEMQTCGEKNKLMNQQAGDNTQSPTNAFAATRVPLLVGGLLTFSWTTLVHHIEIHSGVGSTISTIPAASFRNKKTLRARPKACTTQACLLPRIWRRDKMTPLPACRQIRSFLNQKKWDSNWMSTRTQGYFFLRPCSGHGLRWFQENNDLSTKVCELH